MWLETMAGLLGDVPALSTTLLGELRAQDRKSRDLVVLLNEEESKLFESMKNAQKEAGFEFDEAPFVAKAQVRAAAVSVCAKCLWAAHVMLCYMLLSFPHPSFPTHTHTPQELMQERAELVLLLEEQGKRAQGLYDAIDAKIEMFDERTESIQVRPCGCACMHAMLCGVCCVMCDDACD
jgi:hypothetical protein